MGDKDLLNCIEKSIQGGVTIVQLREKKCQGKEFLRAALEIKEVTDSYNIPLIINDRVDIALCVNATGVHLGPEDIPVPMARKVLGNEKIIGASACSLTEALKLEREGADYLGVGAVFPTSTKEDADNVSITQLKEIKDAVSIPVVAIGGINKDNIHLLNGTGIDGVAVVSAILENDDVKTASTDLLKIATF